MRIHCTATGTIEVDFVGASIGEGIQAVRVAGAACAFQLVIDLRTGALLIDVEVDLVHICISSRSVVADIVDGVAPPPFPSGFVKDITALGTVSEAVRANILDVVVIISCHLFEQVAPVVAIGVCDRVVDNDRVAAINRRTAVYRFACCEVGLHVTDAVRSDDSEVLIVVNRAAIIKSIIDSCNASQRRDVLIAAILCRNGVVACSCLVRDICLDGDGVIQHKLSAIRRLTKVIVQVSIGVGGIHRAVEVVCHRAAAGIRLHIGGIPVLHVPLFCFAEEVIVGITEVHRVRGVINVQRHDGVPLAVGLIVEVCGVGRVHGFQLDIAAELIERLTIAVHKAHFHVIDIFTQLTDIADALADLTVAQLDRTVRAVRYVLEAVQTTTASHVAEHPSDSRGRILVAKIRDFSSVDCLVIVRSTVNRAILIQNIRSNGIQRDVTGTTTRVRVACLRSPSQVTVVGIEVVQQQRLGFQRSHLNGRSVHNQVTGTAVRLIVCNRCVVANLMGRSFVVEHAAEVQTIPIHCGILNSQSDRRMLLHGRDTRLAEIVQRVPEVCRPELEGTHLIRNSLRHIFYFGGDFKAARREQIGITADIDPNIVLVTILNGVSHAVRNALPIVQVEVESGRFANRNALIESLLDEHRTKRYFAVAVLAILGFVEARILLATNRKLALKLNLLTAVVERVVRYSAFGVRNISVRSRLGKGGLVDFALDDAIIGGEGSAGAANLEPLAGAATLGDGTIVPNHVRVRNSLVIVQLAANGLVDGAFPVFVIVNRVCCRLQQFQRMSLAVVPEMIRNVHDNHAVLGDAAAIGVKNLGTLHTSRGHVGDDVLAITIDHAVVICAISCMNHNAIAGVVRNTVIREQSVQVANNTSDTGDTDVRLVVQLQNGQSANGLIVTKVPTIVAARGVHTIGIRGVVEQRLTVACEVHMVRIRVPVTGEVFDRSPALRQSQVINNLIAAVQRIPERATGLQSRQNLHVVDRTYTDNEVAILLAILIRRADFALFALGNVHDGVGEQASFTYRRRVFG